VPTRERDELETFDLQPARRLIRTVVGERR
jgi:hypothetical protein